MLLHAKSRTNTAESASETNGYFRHYGLRQDPFCFEGKENCFYLLPDWEQHIDLILHYLRHENVLLTLTGPKGIGKTTYINSFLLEAIHGFTPTETAAKSKLCPGEMLVQLGDTTRTCQVIADNALDPEQILEVIASAFDLSTEFLGVHLEEQADLLLEKLQHSKQRCVLLIDQAHELPDSTLTLLLYLINQQSDIQHQFHVVLIGDTTLKKRFTKLSKSKDQSSLIHSIELGPLNLAQTEYYIKHRFSAAGLQDDDIPIPNGSIQKIYKLSGGVPKTINQLARQLLIEGLKKNSLSSLGAVFKPYKKTLVGGSFLLTSFAIILFYLGQDTRSNNAYSIEASQSQIQPVVVENRTIQPINLPSPISPEPSIKKEQEVVVSSIPNPHATENTAVANEPFQSSQAQITTVQPTAGMSPITAATQPNIEKTVQPNLEPSPAEVNSATDTNLVVVEKDSSPQQVVIESSSLIEPTSVKTSDALTTQPPPFLLREKKSEQVLAHHERFMEPTPLSRVKVDASDKKAEHKNKKTKIKAKTDKANAESARFAHLNPHHYTLKLTRIPSHDFTKSLFSKNKFGKNLMYIRSEENAYSIVYGEYADNATARRAIDLLPNSLKSFNAKPTRIGTLQKLATE